MKKELDAVADRLTAELGERIERDVPFSRLTTYGLGGPAAVLVRATGEADLVAVARALPPGVPFLTVGLFLGCVWGQEAWATYWGWDIKETWAFITWAVFLVYFHLRMTPHMKGARSAMVVVLGGMAVLVTWMCMHLLPESVSSLHTYTE